MSYLIDQEYYFINNVRTKVTYCKCIISLTLTNIFLIDIFYIILFVWYSTHYYNVRIKQFSWSAYKLIAFLYSSFVRQTKFNIRHVTFTTLLEELDLYTDIMYQMHLIKYIIYISRMCRYRNKYKNDVQKRFLSFLFKLLMFVPSSNSLF